MTTKNFSNSTFNSSINIVQMLESDTRKNYSLDSSKLTNTEQALIDEPCFVLRQENLARAKTLTLLSGQDYYDQVLRPLESNDRTSVKAAIAVIADSIIKEESDGPLYLAEISVTTESGQRHISILAQDRSVANGVWSPKHHIKANEWALASSRRNLPVVTFIDTPGADAGALANQNNQAHQISGLIAAMADLKVPTLGIVWGGGYSGGAIPLATTNLLLSVRDGVFNTIQPQGLASIARKQGIDWKTCASLVGISPAELCLEGLIDGVVDYSPCEGKDKLNNLKLAILYSIEAIEKQTLQTVRDWQPISEYYQQQLRLITNPNEGAHLCEYHSVYGLGFRVERSRKLRARLGNTGKSKLNRESIEKPVVVTPEQEKLSRSIAHYENWQKNSGQIAYEENIRKAWEAFLSAEKNRDVEQGYIKSIFLGSREDRYAKAVNETLSELSFYLYNCWQQEASHHLPLLVNMVKDSYVEGVEEPAGGEQLSEPTTILDLILDPRVADRIVPYAESLILFDKLYEQILKKLPDIVSELGLKKSVSGKVIDDLLSSLGADVNNEQFNGWLKSVANAQNFGAFLRAAEHWKRIQHPRISDVMFVVVSYFFERLIPSYFENKDKGKAYSGHFAPVSIGRRKDFWNRLVQATTDMRIQTILNGVKPSKVFKPEDLLDHVFVEFSELDRNIGCRDRKRFPGYQSSIDRQLMASGRTSGLITGIGTFSDLLPNDANSVGEAFLSVGTFVSNHSFQAGSFDTSSAERFCKLLTYCATYSMPVVGFISSGGMQTKEGASALFSMAVVNDRINWFVKEIGLPILVFGYGDCTGGAQASLVTHPLVTTCYFSGTNMPFAGRIVVPEYLPVMATLSNYLVKTKDSMQSMVAHPFVEDLDDRLREIDSKIGIGGETIQQRIRAWLADENAAASPFSDSQVVAAKQKFDAYKRVLIHARGCTAVKLINEAHASDLSVILVQSDPDMNSVAADLLKDSDELVCIGGYTSDESYLNGDSVLRIAELHNAEAIHPGIGFLSENHQFAHQCLEQGLNFIGPSPQSMEQMGDKARAIHTAISHGVPVVPGSHGIVSSVTDAIKVAKDTGLPIILKAAYGGGGKGIAEVHSHDALEEEFQRIQAEAKSSFGKGDIYIERLVTKFRHIEVQLLRDSHGCTQILGMRDCSVQRNKQKIIEESSSVALSESAAALAKESTRRLANACDYHGAGTVEFIYDLESDALYFMEMNTRLQVEHPVTEKVSGVDIVKQQYEIAKGASIADLEIGNDGYAIEVRINAEKIRLNGNELKVTPCPGDVRLCEFPESEKVDTIVSVATGKTVSPYYDNLVAQVIAHADSRDEAIAVMLDFLNAVKIEGVETNIELLKLILVDEKFVEGGFDTRFLESLTQREMSSLSESLRPADEAVTQLDKVVKVEGTEDLKVLSPSMSVLYHSPSPDKASYVAEGDVVDVDQTLCLLETMKMFRPVSLRSFNDKNNEIYPSTSKYRVLHVKGADGQQVNEGELLFVVKPIDQCD